MFTLKNIAVLLVLATLTHLISTGFAQDCVSDPCMNNGTCTETDNGDIMCNCTEFFTGEFCEFNNSCISDPCENGGSCTDNNGTAVCNCTSDYEGEFCQDQAMEGSGRDCETDDNCENGGTCNEDEGICVCVAPWEGRYCNESSEVVCNDEECLNGGYCDESQSCVCINRWEGAFCNETRVCDMNPCNGGICTPSINNEPVCNCSGLNLEGPTCSLTTCEAEEYTNLATNETFWFPETLEGQTQSTNTTCGIDTEFSGKPAASRYCGGNYTWEDPVFLDCNTSLNELPLNDQINAVEVITSDPELITETDVGLVVGVMQEVATSSDEDLSDSSINSLMSTTNSLLQTTNDARLSVQQQADSILSTLNVMGRERAALTTYTRTDSEVALISPQLGTPVDDETDGGYRMKRQEGATYSFSQSEVLVPSQRFTAADFQYSAEPADTSNSLYAESSDVRVFFQAFHDSDLLFINQTDSIVMSVQRFDQTEDLGIELKFYLFEFYPELNATPAMNSRNETFFCSRWNDVSNSWDDSSSSCSVDSVEIEGVYNFITCSCTKTGYFTITSRVVEETNNGGDGNNGGQTGLTDGEIAGIVIGSIAGAVLIIGGIVYFVKRKNSKSKVSTSKVSSAHHNVMNSSSEEDIELADKRSTSSSEDGNKL